ncbi:MAG TPA: DUF2127 domain-containing protein [Ktedonobacteraceae bacterium]|nr:DUF2127 domain-containing protein [Ktedonobacteraceae bacterium]
MLNVQRSRPLGITIIAIIMAVFGILGIIAGIGLLSFSASLGFITIIMGVLQVILAWGLWTLRPWAYWATVILEVLALLNAIFALSTGVPGQGIFGMVIALIILIYLFADPNVRAAFRTGI